MKSLKRLYEVYMRSSQDPLKSVPKKVRIRQPKQTHRMFLSVQQRVTHDREMNFNVYAKPMGSVYGIYMTSI